jgi:hypothetical protein
MAVWQAHERGERGGRKRGAGGRAWGWGNGWGHHGGGGLQALLTASCFPFSVTCCVQEGNRKKKRREKKKEKRKEERKNEKKEKNPNLEISEKNKRYLAKLVKNYFC